MTRCDTCSKNLDQMEAQSVQTQNGAFCLTCAGCEIDRLHKIEASQRWRKWPEEVPEKQGSANPCQVVLFPIRGDTSEFYPSQATYWHGRWLLDELRSDDDVTNRVKYWRPIGPLPEGE